MFKVEHTSVEQSGHELSGLEHFDFTLFTGTGQITDNCSARPIDRTVKYLPYLSVQFNSCKNVHKDFHEFPKGKGHCTV